MHHLSGRGLGGVVTFALAALASGLGCSGSTTFGGKDLSISLTVDRTTGAAAVDTFIFEYEARGTDLLGIVLDFGDGQLDSLGALGASTVGATRAHVYELPGNYEAHARAQEALGAVAADTVTVQVQLP